MTATTLTNLWKSVPPPVPPGTPVNLSKLTGTRRANAFVHYRRFRPGSLRHFPGTHLIFRFRVTSWFTTGGVHCLPFRTSFSVRKHRFAQNGI